VSHPVDILADACRPVPEPLGVRFDSSASGADAAALLGARLREGARPRLEAMWRAVDQLEKLAEERFRSS
jgi:hypothetical protein